MTSTQQKTQEPEIQISSHEGNFHAFRIEMNTAIDYLSKKKPWIVLPGELASNPSIFFSTGNYGKAREFAAFLEDFKDFNDLLKGLFEFRMPEVPEPGLPEIEESGTTFFENSAIKASESSKFFGAFTLAEDSGLCVPALDGEPGVYSARYFENNISYFDHSEFLEVGRVYMEIMESDLPEPVKKKDATDLLNNAMMVARLRHLSPSARWFPAHFQTVASISDAKGNIVSTGVGTMAGSIVIPKNFDLSKKECIEALRGDFGYNCIFGVKGPGMVEGAMLRAVPLRDRLKWNHRSIAISRAIVGLLLKYTRH